jgi:hypothetical protein
MVRANGLVRDFYETLKIGTSDAVGRIFITGISPVMMDDLTSGFNIDLFDGSPDTAFQADL